MTRFCRVLRISRKLLRQIVTSSSHQHRWQQLFTAVKRRAIRHVFETI